MSLTDVRPYFRARLGALGYREWKDGFATDNIPDTIADRSYHIATPTIVQTQHNQIDLQLVETVDVSFFVKGFRDPAGGIDEAHVQVQRMLREILDHGFRTTGNLKNVTMSNVDIEPYGDDNDNMIRVTLTFECLVIIDVRD